MAEATTEISVTPKQLGKHLRAIRRKKGLSLSEVARGAGLSRRELVNYERGKVPIPESDLWVLAGSCGVDVSDLMPTTAPSLELTAAASSTSVEDTVSQLRRGQEDAGITAYLHTLQKLQALPAGKRIPVKERELEEIATALGSTPRSIEEKLQEVLQVSPDEAERLRAMILVPPNGRGKPRALAAAPSVLAAAAALEAASARVAETPSAETPSASPFASVPTPTPFAAEAAEVAAPPPPVAPVLPPEPVQAFPVAPAAFLDQPLDAPLDDVSGHNVDVFEELARLPEPVPLGDPSAPLPDVLAPQDPFAAPFAGVPAIGPPEGAVELVDSAMSSAASSGAAAWNAAEAPPIDVAMRQGSSTWDLGEPPLVAKSTGPDSTNWETDGWQPPAPEGTTGTESGFWEGTDDWTPPEDATETAQTEAVETDGIDAPTGDPMVLGEDTWAGAAWDPEPWTSTETPAADTVADVNPWAIEEWPQEPADRGAWDHRPDQAAVDTGFYVDWGTPETEAPPGWDVFAEATTTAPDGAPENAPESDETVEAAGHDTFALFDGAATPVETEALPDEAVHAWNHWAEPTDAVDEVEAIEPDVEVEAAVEYVMEPVAELAPISWRADGSQLTELEAAIATGSVVVDDSETAPEDPFLATPWIGDAPATNGWADPPPEWTTPVETEEPVGAAFAATTQPEPEPEPEPVIEEFVTAGPDWQLGNALPLVEVRGQGGLVMRRADERWALADITTTPDFVAEVEVDFRSGPGLGVLFRASTDDEGRMSGYSFDIDPIYDGGGYLVRQWQADRELWNPIARVSGDDPASMYGTLLVRIEVVGEHLSAQVNGVEVLTVENLKQASADRGRDAATGDRIGVQAWSSSDLVIDTARVASR